MLFIGRIPLALPLAQARGVRLLSHVHDMLTRKSAPEAHGMTAEWVNAGSGLRAGAFSLKLAVAADRLGPFAGALLAGLLKARAVSSPEDAFSCIFFFSA